MGKKKPIFGLEKLPPKAYIKSLEDKVKELNTERGKDQSYIEELEDELEGLRSLSEEQLKEVNKDNLIKSLRGNIKDLNNRLKSYKRDLKEQIYKNLQNGKKE